MIHCETTGRPFNAATGLARVLLHLPSERNGESFVRLAIKLAQAAHAQIRGLSLIDTSRLEELSTRESAAFAVFELNRLRTFAAHQHEVRRIFSHACLAAGLDFELKSRQGNPHEVLCSEARFHDLSIVAAPSSARKWGSRNTGAVIDLVLRGVTPLLVVRRHSRMPQRVLLVHDGSHACGRAIRSFLSQSIVPLAQVRLLAVGTNVEDAERILRENAGYLQSRVDPLESGYIVGRTARVVPAYANQWEADLVVLGAQRSPPLMRRIFGEAATRLLQGTKCILYVTD